MLLLYECRADLFWRQNTNVKIKQVFWSISDSAQFRNYTNSDECRPWIFILFIAVQLLLYTGSEWQQLNNQVD